jgi:hypothetical protein
MISGDESVVPVLVVGDSHAKIFAHPTFSDAFPKIRFESAAISGATISGFRNPNSETQALPIIRQRLERTSASLAISMFGEIDTGFVIWYRSRKYGHSVSSMLEETLVQYRAFMEELYLSGLSVLCISTPLPTIPDGYCFGDVANARAMIAGTQKERTALTRTFNQEMQAYCRQRRFGYVMLDEISTGADGLVSPDLKNPDPGDHHYNPDRYSMLLIGALRRFGEAHRGIYEIFL